MSFSIYSSKKPSFPSGLNSSEVMWD